MLHLALILASLSHAPNAQLTSPQGREPVTQSLPSIDDILANIRAAYSTEPWAERIRVSVREPDGSTGRANYVVRHNPAAPARTRIELGRLTFLADSMRIVATSSVVPNFHATIPVPEGSTWQETLADATKPIMLPQLALAASTIQQPFDLTPFSPGTTFSSISRPDRGTPNAGSLILSGSSTRGTVTLAIDPKTNRFRQLVTTSNNASGNPTSITLDFTPISLGDNATWSPDLSKSRPVANIAELVAAAGVAPGGLIEPGDVVSVPIITMLDGTSVKPGDYLTQPFVGGDDPHVQPQPVCLLYIRVDAAATATPPDAIPALKYFDHLREENRTLGVPVRHALFVIIVPPATEGANLELVDRAASGVPEGLASCIGWTPDARSSIQLFDDDARCLLVVIEPGGWTREHAFDKPTPRLDAVIRFDGRASDPAEIVAAEIEPILKEWKFRAEP